MENIKQEEQPQSSDVVSSPTPSTEGDLSQTGDFQLNFDNIPQEVTEPPAQGPYKLFVGQLPKTMQDEDLKKIFEPYGTILEFNIIKDRLTGVNRGMVNSLIYNKSNRVWF